LLALLGAFMFSLEGCGDEPNPCKEKKPFTADFGIYQSLGDSLYIIDTVLLVDPAFRERTLNSSEAIVFKASGDYDTYEWKIGDDPRIFTQKQFALNFDRAALGEIKVTLTATGKAVTSCFADDDGRDTQVQSFRILRGEDFSLSILGKFEGYVTSNPSRKFTFEIRDFGLPPINWDPNNHYYIRTHNFPEGCSESLPFALDRFSYGINQFSFSEFYMLRPGTSPDCVEPERIIDAYGKVSTNGNIKIFYRFTASGSNLVKRNAFIGKRLK